MSWTDGRPVEQLGSGWALDQCRGRVLDIGADGGRAALELHRRGHDVVALDSSVGAVNVCKKQGVQQTVHGTLERYAHLAEFDTYLLFGNSLGLLESPTHGQAVIDAIASAARPDVVIVGTSTRPTATTCPVHLRYHESNNARGRLPGQLRLRSRSGPRIRLVRLPAVRAGRARRNLPEGKLAQVENLRGK